MATPTRAELRTQLRNLIDLWDEVHRFASRSATNWVGIEDTATQALESDYPAEILAGISSMRAALAGVLGTGDQALVAHLRDWMRLIDRPATDPQIMIDELFVSFLDTPDAVRSRSFTKGATAAAAGNIGNGTVQRLNTDAYAFDMEWCTAEAKRADCVRDANSGTDRGREVFRFRGADASRDGLEDLGSAIDTELAAAHSKDSLLLNPSFDSFGGTAAIPTSITNWSSSVTVNSANYTFDSTNVYLPAPDQDTTIYALQMRATATLRQRLDLRRTALDPKTPYYARVAFNRAVGAAAGTLRLQVGSRTSSVSVVAQAGWNVLRFSPGQNSWFQRFNQDQLSARVIWTRSSGNLLVDDVTFVPYTFVDGTGYVVEPGATPFQGPNTTRREGDAFTWTDTEVTTVGIVQRWTWKKFGRYLPHSASPTITDP